MTVTHVKKSSYNLMALLPLFLLCGLARGQEQAAAPTAPEPVEAAAPEPALPTTPDAKPADLPSLSGLMLVLSDTLTGKPVVVVTPADESFTLPREPAWETEKTLISKLQAISEAASPTSHLIPFRIRNAWTIAPEKIWTLDPDVPLTGSEQVAGRNFCMETFLAEADEAAARGLGAREGLPLTSLPEKMQSALRCALRPPLKTGRYRQGEAQGASGERPLVLEDESEISAAPDWSQVRVRARLSLSAAEVALASDPNASALIGGAESRLGVFVRFENGWRDVEPVGLTLAPNTFKPSALEGRRLSAPIGVSGVMPLRVVLDRIGTVGAFKIYSAPLNDIRVFIGHRDIPAGEVLDAVRLGLEASFRSIAGGYALAWDIRGAGALQQRSQERSAPLSKEVAKDRRGMFGRSGLLALADQLTFAEDDSLALTEAQRERLLSPDAEGPDGIAFSELTPQQQEALRRRSKGETIWEPAGDSGQSASRPVTEADLQRSRLGGQLSVAVSVLLPDLGWARVENDGWGSLDAGRLQMARRRQGQADPDDEDIPPEILNPEPGFIPAAERGLVVPVLGPVRLATLSDEMKRHGANVLFYPALFEGYATFPTTVFPLHPALRGEDGLGAALREAKRNSITVVPVVSMLAWQGLDQKSHWLNRHPDWLDREVAGRTAVEFWEANGRPGWSPFGSGSPPANYVRPGVPEVATRLKGLVSALLAKPDIGGILFTDWNGMDAAGPMDSPVVLQLGYALPEREAAVRAAGVDPIDEAAPTGFGDLPASAQRLIRLQVKKPAAPSPEFALLNSLVEHSRSARPGVKIYLAGRPMLAERRNGGGEMPKADVVLANLIGGGGREQGGVLMPVWSRGNPPAIFDEAPPKIRDFLMKQSSVALLSSIFRMEGFPGGSSLKCVAFDFRQSPEEITDALQWLKPPPAPVKAGAPPAPAKPVAPKPSAPKPPAPVKRK